MNRPELPPAQRVSSPLQARREALAQRLAVRLGEQAPIEELRELQERLQLVDAQIVASTPRRPAMRRHAIAALVVVAVVSVAALVPVPRVSFALELDAGAVQMQMRDKGALGGDVVDGELRAEGFDRLESGDAALVRLAGDEGAGQFALRAQNLRLARIAFPAGARIEMEGGARTVRVAIDGAPQAAQIEVAGAVSTSLGGAAREQHDAAAAEWIRLSSTKAPTELWLGRAAEHSYRWRGLQPVSLRFVQREAGADGQVRVVSSLQRGALRLPATGRELSLAAGSDLVLDHVQLDHGELSVGDSVKLHASGTAGAMTLRTGGFEQSLKPSLLEHASHNHTLALLWSAAGMLWGISTWLRKAFGERE